MTQKVTRLHELKPMRLSGQTKCTPVQVEMTGGGMVTACLEHLKVIQNGEAPLSPVSPGPGRPRGTKVGTKTTEGKTIKYKGCTRKPCKSYCPPNQRFKVVTKRGLRCMCRSENNKQFLKMSECPKDAMVVSLENK